MTNKLDRNTADRLNRAMPKLFKLLVLVADPRANKDEREAAITTLNKSLKSAGADIHDMALLVRELQEAEATKTASSPLTKDEVNRVLEKGIEIGRKQGREEEAAKHRSTAVVFPSGVGNGINGYSWREIIAHCAANPHCLTRWENEFITSLADQFASYRNAPTAPQASKLRGIFNDRFYNTII
jgi:hypothetical protein